MKSIQVGLVLLAMIAMMNCKGFQKFWEEYKEEIKMYPDQDSKDPQHPVTFEQQLEAQIGKTLERHNAVRAKHKKTNPLIRDKELDKMAQEYAEYLLPLNYLPHLRPEDRQINKKDVGENLFRATGFSFQNIGEQMTDYWYDEIIL